MAKILLGIGCAVLLGLSTVALAGARLSRPVVVDRNNRTAEGALGTARNSADARQFIACGASRNDDVEFDVGFCVAITSTGVNATCFIQDPEVIGRVETVKGDSFVSFAWDVNGLCTRVNVSNGSGYAPKNP